MEGSHYRLYNPSTDFEEVTNLQLRQADVDEIKASCGLTSKEALLLSCYMHTEEHGEMYVVIHKNKIEGVFGVMGTPKFRGVIWFLATDKFSEYAFQFTRTSKMFVELMLDKYYYLDNCVSVDHKESIKWLRWLGFTVDSTEIIKSVYGGDFYHFYKEKVGD